MDTFEAITQRRAVKQFDPDHKMTKFAIVLKSGDSRPVSQINSRLRGVSRSRRLVDWILLS
jgi:hypothetical protein